ncbi:beta-L-arabinofuranosidase domain-containing protein [Maribellus sp. YY47]|uniref:beta-L-arabinofuranosidase domain-containing protein n=1 Tax=Maribellus sp. YY47 TaxID=2929486 RepID=UPI002000A19D|nr:beta-L-arabinofuranosidase domain-containing protein [Maribellus sp. YY47]MCK3683465.1 glycoside hydrolase family 127 protein [Maribellus sp. YY47]
MLICSAKAGDKNKVQDKFSVLPSGAVQLDGYLDGYIQKSIKNWNKGVVPYASFVDFFRNGRPQFALGEMWGKAVRSGCMFYRYTQDPELKRIMEATVKDLLSAQRADGSISCIEPEKQPDASDLWERKYVMLGLEEYYEWVNPDPAVLNALIKHADNIIYLIGHAPKTEITDVGWSATNIGYEACHVESSTLFEPFMRLYKWTNEQRYLDFASYIFEAGGTKNYNVFEMALNNVEPYKMAGHYPKAYETTSLFEGLVEYYRVTQNPEVLQMIQNYFNNVRTKEITIIGNGGSDQPYHPMVAGEAWGNTAVEQTNPDITRMMETCVGVTWMKFCSQVSRLTGTSSAMDEIEKYVYNGLIGAMKPEGDGFSYVNLLNGTKVNGEGWGWMFDSLHVTCCNLNGPMGLAYLPYVAVMRTDEGPVVNLYNTATADFVTAKGTTVQLKIETDFPRSGLVKIKILSDKPASFPVMLRIPGWSEKTSLSVNNKPVEVTPGTYAEIRRKWNPGDEMELQLDMRCRIVDAPKGSNRAGDHFNALIRGPIVLARDENIDENYNQPVNIVSEDGYVNIMPGKSSDGADSGMEFRVPVEGGFITVVDYASVNNWNGKHICTWLPTAE